MAYDIRKVLALASLLLLWGFLVYWQWSAIEEPVKVPLSNVSGPIGLQLERAAAGGLRVQLDLLAAAKSQRDMTFVTPRNIFAAPGGREGNAGIEVPGEASQVEQVVAAELAQFHYLGFVRSEDQGERKRDLAVLTKNDDLHLVRRGETVENRVVVKAITQESVTLMDRDSHVEYTVLLSEEASAQP